jgi:hypothetical protein
MRYHARSEVFFFLNMIFNFLIETYTLIYGFLASREHTKAAKSVKKAAKESQTVSIKPSVVSAQYADKTQSTPLEDIIHEWKQQKARIAELEETKSNIQEQAQLLGKKARRLEETLAEMERKEKERLKEEEKRNVREKEKAVDEKKGKSKTKEKKKTGSSSSSDERCVPWHWQACLITYRLFVKALQVVMNVSN